MIISSEQKSKVRAIPIDLEINLTISCRAKHSQYTSLDTRECVTILDLWPREFRHRGSDWFPPRLSEKRWKLLLYVYIVSRCAIKSGSSVRSSSHLITCGAPFINVIMYLSFFCTTARLLASSTVDRSLLRPTSFRLRFIFPTPLACRRGWLAMRVESPRITGLNNFFVPCSLCKKYPYK